MKLKEDILYNGVWFYKGQIDPRPQEVKLKKTNQKGGM